MHPRVHTLKQKINDLYTLIGEWEQKRDLSENPSESQRSQLEINRLQSSLQGYQAELTQLQGQAQVSSPSPAPSPSTAGTDTKQAVETLLSQGQLEAALMLLKAHFQALGDPDPQQTLILHLGRYHENEKNFDQNLISYETYQTERTRLRRAIARML